MNNKTQHCDNNTNLSFVVIGCGEKCDVDKMLSIIQKSLKIHLAERDVHILSDYTLERAVSKQDLLLKPSTLTLRTSRNGAKCYYGFFNPIDISDVKHRMLVPCECFFDAVHKWQSQKCYTYSKELLKKVLREHFCNSESHYHGKGMGSDVRITISCNEYSNDKKCMRFEYCIRRDCLQDELPSYIHWMNAQIVQLDKLFKECFCSAYISLNFDPMPIIHEFVYDILLDSTLKQYLLGIEWSFYANSIIAQRIIDLLPTQIQITHLDNGILCTAKEHITEYTDTHRVQVSNLLSSSLVSGMKEYSFSALLNSNWKINYPPKRIDVYDGGFYDALGNGCQTLNPDIYLSYEYNEERLLQSRPPQSQEHSDFMYTFKENCFTL